MFYVKYNWCFSIDLSVTCFYEIQLFSARLVIEHWRQAYRSLHHINFTKAQEMHHFLFLSTENSCLRSVSAAHTSHSYVYLCKLCMYVLFPIACLFNLMAFSVHTPHNESHSFIDPTGLSSRDQTRFNFSLIDSKMRYLHRWLGHRGELVHPINSLLIFLSTRFVHPEPNSNITTEACGLKCRTSIRSSSKACGISPVISESQSSGCN